MRAWMFCCLAGLMFSIGCGTHTADETPQAESAVTVPDEAFGLRTASVFEAAESPAFSLDQTEPGDGPRLDAPYHGAPLLISHTLIDNVPILLDENACIDCHDVAVKEEGEATPIPESHFVDLRHTPNEVGDEVAGARYNCIACHATTSDASQLVENQFQN